MHGPAFLKQAVAALFLARWSVRRCLATPLGSHRGEVNTTGGVMGAGRPLPGAKRRIEK